MKKTYRQGQILNLIRNQTIRTQDELAESLKKIGIDVTQVTLSRDIHELGLLKGPGGYHEPPTDSARSTEVDTLPWMLQEFVQDVKTASNLVILKTAPGNAQSVAAALDREGWPQILGTLAGDDTIFVATPDHKQAILIRSKLLEMLR